jgi:hypothetical protein
MKTYAYQWFAHPFDKPVRIFTVKAATESEADAAAKVVFQGMFDRGETVMMDFHGIGEVHRVSFIREVMSPILWMGTTFATLIVLAVIFFKGVSSLMR